MKIFNKVAIVGVGLIGGSLALDIKKKRLAREVIGVSRHKKSILLAKRKGAIDRGSQSLDIIKGSDLVILATPVNTILDSAWAIAKIIPKDCIITDVGSTKGEIVSKLGKIFPNYVGSHPLAGLEKRGIRSACQGLFNGTLCILTPTKNSQKEALNKISWLWGRLGAKTVFLAPREHDEIMSFISHLPHVAAFSLIGAIPKEYLKFGATGLKDTTRIAASDSEIWADIFLSNRKNIARGIKLLQRNLSFIASAIQKNNHKRLALFLKKAKEKRERLN